MEKGFINYLLGLLTAVALSVLIVFVMAIIISGAPIPTEYLRPVNQVVKAVSLFIGALIALKGDKGFLKGSLFGVVYAVAVDLLFALIAGKFELGFDLLIDLFICALVGAIVGVIKVNTVRQ